MSKPLLALLLLLLVGPSLAWSAEAPAAAGTEAAHEGEAAAHVDWHSWHAGNEVSNLSSLQRGARNFFAYCASCHSLKFMRYSRMAEDLKISTEQLQQHILPPDARAADYIVGGLNPTDAVAWFGKEPPDLSLITRARHGGVDYVYRFLKTFYVDPARATNTNNLQLAGAAMPAILSDLGGVQEAVFTDVENVVDGKTVTVKVFSHFETTTPGLMTPVQFDAFVRDTVNFLDYVGEPTQVVRREIGVWVVLFLLALTWMAWLLKKDYWKDVH